MTNRSSKGTVPPEVLGAEAEGVVEVGAEAAAPAPPKNGIRIRARAGAGETSVWVGSIDAGVLVSCRGTLDRKVGRDALSGRLGIE